MATEATLRRALRALPGVAASDSMFTPEEAYWVNGTEIAHLEGDRHLGIRLTRPEIRVQRERLAAAGDTVRRRAPSSDWVVVDFSTRSGYRLAMELAGRAAAIHAAPPGTAAAEPPTGSRLAGLRRFH
jgi:hypothetical protein